VKYGVTAPLQNMLSSLRPEASHLAVAAPQKCSAFQFDWGELKID
jgi:hypothetical protein